MFHIPVQEFNPVQLAIAEAAAGGITLRELETKLLEAHGKPLAYAAPHAGIVLRHLDLSLELSAVVCHFLV
jgi:hypothetical protein